MFYVETKQLVKLGNKAFNCDILIDKQVVMACQDGWVLIDQTYRVKGSRFFAVDDSKLFKFKHSIGDIWTGDNYVTFFDYTD